MFNKLLTFYLLLKCYFTRVQTLYIYSAVRVTFLGVRFCYSPFWLHRGEQQHLLGKKTKFIVVLKKNSIERSSNKSIIP